MKTQQAIKVFSVVCLAAGMLIFMGANPSAECECPLSSSIKVKVEQTFQRLLADEDTDGDAKITIDDRQTGTSAKGDKKFTLESPDGKCAVVNDTCQLSLLLQELALARENGARELEVTPAMMAERPADRISRLIRERYWDALTRRIDAEHLSAMLTDEKQVSVDGYRHLYVPGDDLAAFAYFEKAGSLHPEWKLKVGLLPENITPEYVRGLDGRHGILSLRLIDDNGAIKGVPFVVPGGRFNEMYGWDSYFESLGLIADGRPELARAMVDNFVYQIEHYEKILNANRSYYLTRSQPPFLTSMALAVYNSGSKDAAQKEWLAGVFRAAIKEYRQVWTGPERLTGTGLSRYFDSGRGPCPEVEPRHYDSMIRPYADAVGLSPAEWLAQYEAGKIASPEMDKFFIHDRAVRESGHDTTWRFDNRTADFVSVDLNSLLYKHETDIADTIQNELGGSLRMPDGAVETPKPWRDRASRRKAVMNKLMWSQEQGMFFDYDFINRKRSGYVSATTFYPLWAGIATRQQAAALVKNALPLLEMPGGVAATAEKSRGPVTEARPQRQWDYPYGWAPHQMLIWEGLSNYGYGQDARRLAYKWLYMITRNAADYNGVIPEKYDVAAMTHQVFAGYGNVGTQFSYITKEGFGWMNASFQVGLKLLTPEMRDKLNGLAKPEQVFAKSRP